MEIMKKANTLEIKLTNLEKILSLHSDFSIPLTNVVEIKEKVPESGWLDLKFPGTFLPGFIKAGTYLTKRGKEFWYTTKNRQHTYVVELRDFSYKRLVLATNKKYE